MNCPACKDTMVVLELDEVEIDYCASCGGIWLDSGELELLLEDSERKNELLSSFKINENSKEQAIKCPICYKNMQKVLCQTSREICVDKCVNNDGLWFDRDELARVIKNGSFDKDNRVSNLLKDMFGHKT